MEHSPNSRIVPVPVPVPEMPRLVRQLALQRRRVFSS